jgi:hypothetical protein
MCNAHNHSPGCTCGFGGDGHLGFYSGYGFPYELNSESYKQIKERISLSLLEINKGTFTSYVNPNATCPVCGELVYFYQSPNGGRVFFDDLGPPWPKHPCTDNGLLPEKNHREPISNDPSWLKHGWLPLDTSIPCHIDQYYILNGYALSENEKLKIIDYIIPADNDFASSDFRFYRDIDEHKFEILYYNFSSSKTRKIIGSKRTLAIESGLGKIIPLMVGEDVLVEYNGIDLGFKIEVTIVGRTNVMKSFIDKKNIRPDTKRKVNIFPSIKFTLLAKIISIKRRQKEIELTEV